jgi:hypothetical protein
VEKYGPGPGSRRWLVWEITGSSNLPASSQASDVVTVLSVIRHFFDIDESQAWGPSARVRLSKTAGLM